VPIGSTVRTPWPPWMRIVYSHVTFLITVIISSCPSSPNYSSYEVSSDSTSSSSLWSLRVFIHPECCSVQPICKYIKLSTLFGSMCGSFTELTVYCIWYCQIILHNGALSWPMLMDSTNLTILNFWCSLAP
jgi:hypothetical protein